MSISYDDNHYTTGTDEFVDEIQIMTDNDSSKSIRFVSRDTGVSEFIIRQVVHEDIWYFSYKMRKGQFSSYAI